MIDQYYRRAVIAAAERGARDAIADEARDGLGRLAHRQLAERVQTLLSVYVTGEREAREASAMLESASRHVDRLMALQSPTGLFLGGDNVQSPPDSAFTINDVCDTYALTVGRQDKGLARVRDGLASIMRAATEPLLTGGVHTPNHRWELSAALTRIHRSFPDDRLVARVDEWLGEGIDIDADGLYSERSPNYAAHVSNPSLLVMARVLGRDHLRDVVERNLAATLHLIRPDGSVETVQSRRQDQKSTFPLTPYLAQFRSLAVSTGRADFASAARQAAASGIHDARLLAAAMIEPEQLEQLPDVPSRWHSGTRSGWYFDSARLGSWRDGRVETVVYGGSDYPVERRIRSGLANNPTFLRLFAGAAVLDSVRLSRSFFDVGPFRADAVTRIADDRYRLQERVTAAYYQPLAGHDRRENGAYDVVDDGRFSAAMSFALRGRDEVTMTTTIDVTGAAGGADIALDLRAPQLAWALELTFRPGGVFEGVEPIGEGSWLLTGTEGSYRVGSDRIVFGPGGASVAPGTVLYHPGQEYEFLGGTDATCGEHVYIAGEAPSTLVLRIRSERADESGDERTDER